ncbi:MAG: hypothetical protein AB7G75_14130 [Candidatus Binatia bacterium]
MKMTELAIAMVLLLGGPVAAECIYHGVAYSEGARVCMHRTMYMCRGERWVKTAERCWERSCTTVSKAWDIADSLGIAELAVIQESRGRSARYPVCAWEGS